MTKTDTIRVRDILQRPVLISRESARTLQDHLSAAIEATAAPAGSAAPAVILDFEGISGAAPSFVDELIKILEEVVGDRGESRALRMTITNVPMRLSAKFSAIARGHCLSVEERPDGSWDFRSTAA
jgi:hypothetical protein